LGKSSTAQPRIGRLCLNLIRQCIMGSRMLPNC